MKLKKTVARLVEEAEKEVATLSPGELKKLVEEDRALVVDIRDPRELAKEGGIEGAFHCPRGLLEFWVDPESPYFAQEFETEKPVVLYCAMGWRSALAAKSLSDMGRENVFHLGGGFKAWREAGLPAAVSEKKPKGE